MDFPYSQNRLHPTQKPVQALEPLIRAFCKPDGIVLDLLRIGINPRRDPHNGPPLHRYRA
jgi:hypothetical protein